MTGRARLYLALVGALLINVVLFALLPWSVGKPQTKMDLEALNAVNLVEIRRRTPPPPEEQTPEEEPEPPKPPEIPPLMSLQTRPPDIAKMDMSVPDLNFEINPQLAGGLAVAAPPSVSAAPMRNTFGMEEVDQIPTPLTQIKPVYPYRAKRMRLEGKVDVRFLVREDGSVSNIEILGSTPSGVFDDSVRKALSAWRFTPGKKSGASVRTWFATSIAFKLEGS